MVSFLISFKRKFPWLWRVVESVNGMLFFLRHRDAARIAAGILEETSPEGYTFSLASQEDVPSLSAFLESQPVDSFTYFRPHNFDRKTLSRIIKGNSFMVMKATGSASGAVKGYFFLRCFCDNRAFAGLIVDHALRGNGLGTSIWFACSRICQSLGLRMFATIDEKNLPSIRSCDKGTEILTKETISDGCLLVECKSRLQMNKKIIPAL